MTGLTELVVFVAVPCIISGALIAVCVVCVIYTCDRTVRQPQVHISPPDPDEQAPEVNGVEQQVPGVNIEIPSPMELYVIHPYVYDFAILIINLTLILSISIYLYIRMGKRLRAAAGIGNVFSSLTSSVA